MKEKIRFMVYKISNILELFISALIVLVITILSFELVFEIYTIMLVQEEKDILALFLEKALGLVVGIEFVKMLCNHSPGTVVEVLLFAIARQMIVEHLSVAQILVGIISITILFFIRKYLFCRVDKEAEIREQKECCILYGSQKKREEKS